MFKKLVALMCAAFILFSAQAAFAFEKIPTVQNKQESLQSIKLAYPIYDAYHPYANYLPGAKDIAMQAEEVIMSYYSDLADTNKAIEKLNQLSDTSKLDSQINELKAKNILPKREEAARPFDIQRAAIDLYDLTVSASLDITHGEALTLQDDLLKVGGDVLLDDGSIISAPKDPEDKNYKLFKNGSNSVETSVEVNKGLTEQSREESKLSKNPSYNEKQELNITEQSQSKPTTNVDKQGVEPALKLNAVYIVLAALGVIGLAGVFIVLKFRQE